MLVRLSSSTFFLVQLIHRKGIKMEVKQVQELVGAFAAERGWDINLPSQRGCHLGTRPHEMSTFWEEIPPLATVPGGCRNRVPLFLTVRACIARNWLCRVKAATYGKKTVTAQSGPLRLATGQLPNIDEDAAKRGCE